MSSLQASGYHTIYTVDANKNTYEDICQELEDIGGINQQDYGKNKQQQSAKDAIARVNEDQEVHNTGYNEGYNNGYEQQQNDSENTPWNAFKSGLELPISLVSNLL